MKIKKFELTVILTLIFAILFNLFSFGVSCAKIKKDILRLHILANSDSAEDQSLKLAIRDELLSRGYDIFNGAQNLAQAKQKVEKNITVIEQIAEAKARELGFDYEIKAELCRSFFETRHYDNFTLPAGEYEALRITIGSGQGHNWWCVMFPQLCIAASDDIQSLDSLSEDEKELILSNPNCEVRFKCVEIYEKIKKYLQKND